MLSSIFNMINDAYLADRPTGIFVTEEHGNIYMSCFSVFFRGFRGHIVFYIRHHGVRGSRVPYQRTYAALRRATPVSASSPEPNSQTAAGTGTTV